MSSRLITVPSFEGAKSAPEFILKWAGQAAAHVSVKIVDYNQPGWKDGQFFCAILANWFPEKINYSQLKFGSENAVKNLTLAFKVRDEAGIDDYLDVEERSQYHKQVLFLQLNSFYAVLRNKRAAAATKPRGLIDAPNQLMAGSLASLINQAHGIQATGKSTGMIKQEEIKEEDRTYHANKEANKVMAKAFASMIMAKTAAAGPAGVLRPSMLGVVCPKCDQKNTHRKICVGCGYNLEEEDLMSAPAEGRLRRRSSTGNLKLLAETQKKKEEELKEKQRADREAQEKLEKEKKRQRSQRSQRET